MSEESDKIKEAKRIAAGPLGQQMAKFPLLFAKAVVIGQRPSKKSPSKLTSGTVTLVDLGSGPLGVTCAHVISSYREMQQRFTNVVFQVGNVALEPSRQLVAEDTKLDLATIRLTDVQVRELTSGEEIGSCVFRPVSWPPAPIKGGDVVAFGGFPGSLREYLSFDELGFYSWSNGACSVDSVTDDRISCVFEREYWVSSFGQKHQMELRDLGGMSGSPVFVQRDLHWDLVGLIYEFSTEFDIMFCRPLGFLRPDGTIHESAI